MDEIAVNFLEQRKQTAVQVAQQLAAFLGQATKTLDIAIYSFHLNDEAGRIIESALRERAAAGVAVRIAYDAGTQQAHIPGYGYETMGHHASGSSMPVAAAGSDVHTTDFKDTSTDTSADTQSYIQALGITCKPIEAYHALMHDKYAIVDSGTPQAQVWTGSSNWTDDSWTLQESNIIVLPGAEIAAYFTNDFNELWVDGNIASSGAMDSGTVTLQYGGQAAPTSVFFAPNDGVEIDQKLADLISNTQERLTLATVVLTSGKMLGALQQLMQRGVPIEGIYDATQMHGVLHQWEGVPNNRWKIPVWQQVVEYGHLSGKHSTPYTPTSKHDFMHNKVMVSDHTVVTGSYNFSRHAQSNAENILILASEPLAKTYIDYIHSIMQTYSADAGQVIPSSRPAAGGKDPGV
ncbi:MAG: phosphatidylserine/phosphatidylglycerophosphate/cardiolipin synthase family protein [Chloroflexota bacterium]|nr:phosphatidylserine/phosphatidylglycerophosphate/cardiolipin synthase family protein [Chloroflexota bacterium]